MEIQTHRRITIQSLLIPNVQIVALSDLHSDASFFCPNCGAVLSPDDFTDKSYHILDVICDKTGEPEGVMLRCKCGITILLDLNYCFPTFHDILGR